MSLYLPSLPSHDHASVGDLVNEGVIYLEMIQNTLAMVHDSTPDDSHLKPIYLGLECLIHNARDVLNLAIHKDAAVSAALDIALNDAEQEGASHD